MVNEVVLTISNTKVKEQIISCQAYSCFLSLFFPCGRFRQRLMAAKIIKKKKKLMCQVQWISKSFRWREAKIFFKENTGAEGLG